MLSQVLNEKQIRAVHQASMAILERTGIMVPHPDLLDRLEAAGAKVNRDTQLVKLPEELVMRLVQGAGRQFTIYGRDLNKTAAFGVGRRNYNSIAGEALWVDQPGGKRRYAGLEDAATAARFAEGLEQLTIAGAMTDPQELPVAVRCLEVFATMLRNTTKPITFWFHNRASAKYLVEMMIALRGDEAKAAQYPVCYPFLEPISPLRFPFDGLDLLYETARLNLPVPVGPMAQMGISAPGTIAGTLAQENAEVLAGVCLTQLIRSGMPVCYGGICHAFDMATTQMIFAGPEQAIFGVAMTQMGKSYGLPVYINVGLTDAKRPDAQAGLEAGITLAFGAAAGADIFGHLGICGVDQATSLDILVLQHEIISYTESLMREIEFSADTFGLDVIAEAGPGGSFIDQPHTAEHFRKELWFPRLLDRRYFQAWMEGGAVGMEARCRQRTEEILALPPPEPLAPEIDQAFTAILAAARKELVK